VLVRRDVGKEVGRQSLARDRLKWRTELEEIVLWPGHPALGDHARGRAHLRDRDQERDRATSGR
jgi:hypothetical protein